MKTYRETVYSIIEFVSGFHVTDDNPLDEILVGKKMDDVRALLIKQEYEQKGTVNDLFYQQCKVRIEDQDRAKHDDPKEEKERKEDFEIKQFHIDFPELLPNIGWENIKFLGTEGFETKYNRRSADSFIYAEHRRYSSHNVDYTLIGPSRALVRNERIANDIFLLGVFKSPLDVPGMTWDSMYPVPDPFKLEMIVKQDILAGMGIKSDEKNDARHNQEELLGKRN